jgi:hypothetical protein
MNDIFLKEDFLTEINYLRFLIGIVILIGLTFIIKKNYLQNSFSNDNKVFFIRNIYTFSIAITLIVVVIKSSLALSLGLIGALSIIRFRTAIKEPEQIITLLMVMAVSISIAAEKEILGGIMTVIYILLNHKKSQKLDSNNSNKSLVISFKTNEELSLNDIDCAKFTRIYKTKDDNFTVEFLVKEKDINKTIKHFEDKLNLKVEYEVF